MDDIRQTAIDRFRTYLERQQFSAHTVANYTLDLRLFFAEVPVPLAQISFREVDQFVERQHHHGRAWATINPATQCAEALFRLLPGAAVGTRESVKPSHLSGVGIPAQSPPPANRSNGSLPRSPIRWTARCSGDPPLLSGLRGGQPQAGADRLGATGRAGRARQGRKDRRVYMSPDAVASVQQCLEQHPGERGAGLCVWNRKRVQQPLSVKAIQRRWSAMPRRRASRRVVIACVYVCLESPGTRGRSRGDSRLLGAPAGLHRASGMPNFESEDQTGVYADYAENLEAGPGVTQERETLYIIYTIKNIFVVYYSNKHHVWRDTT